MNCDNFLDRYCLLDKDEPLPPALKVHVLQCKTCKETVRRMRCAEKTQRSLLYGSLYSSQVVSSGDSSISSADERRVNTMMCAVYRLHTVSAAERVPQMIGQSILPIMPQVKEEQGTLLPWLAVGLLMIAGFILIPFTELGKMGLRQFGDSFCISFAILCACCISAYSAVFFAKHLVFFTEKFARRL